MTNRLAVILVAFFLILFAIDWLATGGATALELMRLLAGFIRELAFWR